MPRKRGPSIFCSFAVVANRLSNGENVPLVERPVEGRSAMAGRTEDNPLPRVARVGLQGVIGRDEFRNIHQDRGISRLSGGRTNFHLSPCRCPSKGLHSSRFAPETRLDHATKMHHFTVQRHWTLVSDVLLNVGLTLTGLVFGQYETTHTKVQLFPIQSFGLISLAQFPASLNDHSAPHRP